MLAFAALLTASILGVVALITVVHWSTTATVLMLLAAIFLWVLWAFWIGMGRK